jgi:hypothetical protein
MDQTTLAAITNQLVSSQINTGNCQTVTFSNALPISVSAYIVWSNGTSTWAGMAMSPMQASQSSAVAIPDCAYIIWREAVSGAFVCVKETNYSASVTDVSIVQGDLCDPGEIGPVPVPTADIQVPPDSAKVVVACGTLAQGSIVRYQYWHCTDDSYCLPAGVQRTYSLTTSSGLQSTSSDMETVASSISASTSAGWGPVSASMSYSLSTSSTTMHSYTVTEETTRFESVTLSNTTADTVLYFAWQLMDVIEVYTNVNSVVTPTASLISGRTPQLYEGPYALPITKKRPERKGLANDEIALITSWGDDRPVRPTLAGPT